MSFLKFWKGKPSKDSKTGVNAAYVSSSGFDKETAGAMEGHGEYEEGEVDKKSRLKYSLSISRSGRYKSKKKERVGFLDKPEVFNGPENGPERSPKASKKSHSSGNKKESPASSLRGSQSGASGLRRNSSNPSNCREVNQQISSLRLKHPQGITSQPTAV